MTNQFKWALMIGLVIFHLALPSTFAAAATGKVIFLLEVEDAISPGVADYIKRMIERANAEKVTCVIIALDTPGGLAESMRTIIKAILASDVPIVVYISPSGARAASAGVMITMAADIAAMSPGTNIGAAHPVGLGGKEVDKTMSEKVVNDMVAHARSVAENRGRNADWVEKAIRESVSATESEALKKNIIDVIAKDVDDLITQINGRNLKDKGQLDLDNAEIQKIEAGLRTKILKTISDPNIAYILLMIGLAGLYFELSHPGTIFPGVIGGICIILAFFALQTLPINYAGILLILLSIVLFILEMKITSYGLLSIAGIVSLLLGSLMLFESSSPEMKLAWQVLIPTIAMVSIFFVVVAGLVFRSHTTQPRTGAIGLVGEIGIVKKDLQPEGKVLVHGELWNARADHHIPEGNKVTVKSVSNLVLTVESADESRSS